MKDTFRVRIQEELPRRKHVNTSSLAPRRRLVVCQKSFILLSHQTGTPSLSHTCHRQAYHCRARWSISYLNVLQLVRQVRPLGLQHVGLVQSVLQALGQPEDVALLEVHLLLQLPLLWRQRRCDVERRVHIKSCYKHRVCTAQKTIEEHFNVTTKRLSFFHLLLCAIFFFIKK